MIGKALGKLLSAVAVVAMVGCDKTPDEPVVGDGGVLDLRGMMHKMFVDECRNVALGEEYRNANSMGYNAQFKIAYIDERYLSFYSDTWVNSEDYVHGGTSLIVGTIDRKSGNVLKAADLILPQRLAEVESVLRDEVTKKLRNYLLNEPKITDNCFLADDGIHFVYQEYQIAPFSLGPIEVVVEMPQEESKSVALAKIITRSIDGSDPCQADE